MTSFRGGACGLALLGLLFFHAAAAHADAVLQWNEIAVRTLTTQGRMSRWILSMLPVGLLLLMTLINPAYVAPLYFNPIGRILLVLAGVMVVLGSLAIKRIVNIKV